MGWITINGTHIFIRDGESKKAAVKRFIANKRNNKVGNYHKGASFYQEGNVVGITQYRIQKAQRNYKKSNEGYFTAKDKLTKSIKSAEKATKYTKSSTKPVKPTPVSHISVNNSKYYGSYLKNPKGRGNWAFNIGGKTAFFRGTFAEAKKQALKEASKKGLWQIDVLP